MLISPKKVASQWLLDWCLAYYLVLLTQIINHVCVCVCVCVYVCVCALSHLDQVRFSTTLLTVACQTPLSMGFSRQEYWSRLPCSLPDPGIEHVSLLSPELEADSLPLVPPGKPLFNHHRVLITFIGEILEFKIWMQSVFIATGKSLPLSE